VDGGCSCWKGDSVKRGVAGRGDILDVDLNPTSGHEQQGRRPVIVLSPYSFNRLFGITLVCPISQGGGHARNQGFAVTLMGTGTVTQGVVLCHQMRVIDPVSRKARYIETAPQVVVDEVIARAQTLLQ
jgi:mRNA interferase ChpB